MSDRSGIAGKVEIFFGCNISPGNFALVAGAGCSPGRMAGVLGRNPAWKVALVSSMARRFPLVVRIVGKTTAGSTVVGLKIR